MEIRIVTDSTCDLPDETIRELGIAVMPLNIHIGEKAYLDGVDLSREEFYHRLPDLNLFPKTASPNPHALGRLYQRLADEGADEILSIHISESLSDTVNDARVAAKECTRLPVTVLDSGQLSLGMGFLVEKAARMAQAGHALEEILAALKEQMRRSYVFASLKTLEYLKRSGRMHAAVANIGEILKIKLLLHMNQGKPTAYRVRTQRRATERLFEWLHEYAPYERLSIVHAGIAEEAKSMFERIRDFLPNGDVPIVQITPILGAHLGIGALGFACVSKE